MPFDPALTNPSDQIRFAVGDTQTAELLADETYNALLALNGESLQRATLAVVEYLLTRFGQEPTKFRAEGQITVEWGERINSWLRLAARLRAELGLVGGGTVAVGALERPDETYTMGAHYQSGRLVGAGYVRPRTAYSAGEFDA